MKCLCSDQPNWKVRGMEVELEKMTGQREGKEPGRRGQDGRDRKESERDSETRIAGAPWLQ